jgi:hypothetical protein
VPFSRRLQRPQIRIGPVAPSVLVGSSIAIEQTLAPVGEQFL